MSRRGHAGQIAYLTNLYPSPSHSFIRREILALEEAGWQVHRFAHRHNTTALVDPADKNELGRTCALLDLPLTRLLQSAVVWAVKRPRATLAALTLAMRMARQGDHRHVAHFAYFLMACELSRRLRDLDCHHVHAHFGTNPAAVACVANRLCGLRYSLTFHGPHEFDPAERLSLREKIGAASFVAAVSKAGRARLIERFPDLAEKFRLVPCGLEASWFETPRATSSGRKLLCVARLDPQKNPTMLIDAARVLVERNVEFRLVVAGDGSLRQQLQARIDSEGLARHVALVGWQTQQQVRCQLREARALVLSSHAEGLPVVIMEAFALGVPAIAPDVGAISELVETGSSGWLVAPDDAGVLAEAMQQCLLAGPEELQRMGDEARRRALPHDIRASAKLLAEGFACPA